MRGVDNQEEGMRVIDDVDRAAWHNSQHKWSDVSSSLAAPRGMPRPKAPAAQVDRREAVRHRRVPLLRRPPFRHGSGQADQPVSYTHLTLPTKA